ncbi:hypothetical protein GTZ85_12740 [Streptomyces sp. SID5474]|nr:hypothetical protein [Streptomyces sp. SID5474]
MKESIGNSRKVIDEWVASVHAGSNGEISKPLYDALGRIEDIYGDLDRILREQADRATVLGMRDTNTDPVIRKLEPLLDGRVGRPFDEQRHAEEIARAKERADARIPPGYKDFEDGKKGDAEAAGDYLVWRQLLDEALDRKTDVLFVTRDRKEDWWQHVSRKPTRLPRIELVDELRAVTGQRLFIVGPSVLMSHVSRRLLVEREVRRRLRGRPAAHRIGRGRLDPAAKLHEETPISTRPGSQKKQRRLCRDILDDGPDGGRQPTARRVHREIHGMLPQCHAHSGGP